MIGDGLGVPPELEERLFERFIHYGTSPLIVGSVRLGLAITRVLTEGMGGGSVTPATKGHTVFSVRPHLAGEGVRYRQRTVAA
jgi:signal transduction histidine kinase